MKKRRTKELEDFNGWVSAMLRRFNSFTSQIGRSSNLHYALEEGIRTILEAMFPGP